MSDNVDNSWNAIANCWYIMLQCYKLYYCIQVLVASVVCILFGDFFFFIIYLFITFLLSPSSLFFARWFQAERKCTYTRVSACVCVCEVVLIVASAYRFCSSGSCIQVRSCKTVAAATNTAAVGILSEKFIPPTIQATNGRE